MAIVVKTEHPHIVRLDGVCGGEPVIDALRPPYNENAIALVVSLRSMVGLADSTPATQDFFNLF